MRFGFQLFLAVLACAAVSAPAAADQPPATLWDMLFAPPAAASSGWDATVIPVTATASSQSWATTVNLLPAARRIETGSVATGHKAPHGPLLTGAAHALTGVASYYSEDQMTASGEVFDKSAMTAAHKTLPIGSKVKVTNLQNGREAVLRINDRGPYVQGRVIDVSEAAALALGFASQGVTNVHVDLMGP